MGSWRAGQGPALGQLDTYDVGGLIALGTLDDFKFHRRAFLQVTVTVTLDGRVVHENVFATLALDEPVPFRGIEPLDGALFTIVTHVYFCSLLLMLSVRYLLPRAEKHKTRTLLRAAFGYNSREPRGDKRKSIMAQVEGSSTFFCRLAGFSGTENKSPLVARPGTDIAEITWKRAAKV